MVDLNVALELNNVFVVECLRATIEWRKNMVEMAVGMSILSRID